MAQLSYTLLTVLAFSACPTYSFAESPAKLYATRELTLKSYQLEALQKDLPAQQLFFTEQKELWILGQTSLWQWNPQKQKLGTVKLLNPGPLAFNPPLRHAFQNPLQQQTELLVTSDQALFRIQLSPLKLRQFVPEGLALAKAQSFGLFVEKKKAAPLYWVNRSQVWTLDFATPTPSLQLWREHPSLEPLDVVLLCPQENKLWVIRQNQLLVFDYLSPKAGFQRKLSLGEPFQSIEPLPTGFLLISPHSVLVMDSHGEVEKTLPLLGSQQVVGVHIGAQQHSYLLDNGFAEVHNLESRTSRYGQLGLGKLEKIAAMSVQQDMLAFLVAGVPRLFQMEGESADF